MLSESTDLLESEDAMQKEVVSASSRGGRTMGAVGDQRREGCRQLPELWGIERPLWSQRWVGGCSGWEGWHELTTVAGTDHVKEYRPHLQPDFVGLGIPPAHTGGFLVAYGL